MADKIQIRRDTTVEWVSNNPVLSEGEQGYEIDTGKIKIGDGSTAWTSLAYNFEYVAYTDADVDLHLNTSTATTGQVLSYTGTDYDWIDAGGGGSSTLQDVTTAGAVTTNPITTAGITNVGSLLSYQSGANVTSFSAGTGSGTTSLAGSVAIGYQAGQTSQRGNSVAIGYRAAQSGQQDQAVAIGYEAGKTNQQNSATAVGFRAGTISQQYDATAVGSNAGYTGQKAYAVGVGFRAGYSGQATEAVAIGNQAAFGAQATRAVAVGSFAGNQGQQSYGVAIGYYSGYYQQTNGVAIGRFAGSSPSNQTASQQANAVAVGAYAGQTFQGSNAISIGYLAGQTDQGANGVIISSTGVALNDTSTGHIHLASTDSSLDYTTASGWSFASGNVGIGVTTSDAKLEIGGAGEGIILASPDGTRYKISIANGGSLTVVAV